MHCSLYCCIHSLCKPQSPIHRNGILHGKIYIVMILPKTTCCKPFHSFLHIENITHSSKKIIASLICKNLRNGMSCQYTVNLYAKYRSMHRHRSGSAGPDGDSIKTENQVPLTPSNAASMEKPEQCNYISALKNQYNQNIKSSLGQGLFIECAGAKEQKCFLKNLQAARLFCSNAAVKEE